jgi:hypothetical protein
MTWSFGFGRCPKCKQETILTSSAPGTSCLTCKESE